MSGPDLPFPPFENHVLGVVPEPGRMDELHLYHGRKCNRACAFCCVDGEPGGGHLPFTEPVLCAAVAVVASRGSLKIYGGEPTLDAANLRWTIARLRELGFAGAITVFSNGLRPRVLTGLLDADPGVRVVLNYAIAMGSGEKPLPRAALAHLRAYGAAHPGRIFLSHDFRAPVGRQPEEATAGPGEPSPCFRCWPTLTSAGRFHACPFAVEADLPQFPLGELGTPPEVVRSRFAGFLDWVGASLEPEAARQGRHACAVCTGPHPPPREGADARPSPLLEVGYRRRAA